jgi:toxin HigB-1
VGSKLVCKNKHYVYISVIRSFADPETERLFETGKSRRLPFNILHRAAMRLVQLHAATMLDDLRLPHSNRLEALKGNRRGQYAIRINDQWRVCFRFADGDAFDVEITDYH